ncbi:MULTISPECIES: MFS transporter [Oceanobacillus]|uniref:MFS transporter n=1 Tax=Oceanobacillus aidingensis TaxID=645964 RepID=A0ABV9JX31_9BACI|nr:MFS transporter [Oceanobacillus oncorhynchi]MDM8100006.1 MFS transporter [Oceanobacillus oncorhynchi]UUI40555.1 MFS transporter [Oceanobacillus oncorhynchi]
MSIFKNRSFLSIWIGNGISELGGAFGTFCNSILIYQLTGSTLALGSMWLLYFIPSLVLQLFIGPFIDRWSRKWILIFSQMARGFVFLVPLFALWTDSLLPWHVYFVQIIIGLITPLYVPANQAITPSIVAKGQLETANAYLEGTARLMTFTAPFLGGVVIEYLGVLPTMVLVSTLLLLSGFTLLFIQETRIQQKTRAPWIKEFTEGITYFFRKRVIVWLGIFLGFVQFGVGVTMVTTLPYITEELSGSYAAYGYFMAGFPVGFILGSILVGKIKYKSRRKLMLGALFIGGLTFVFLFFNTSILLGILTEVIGGVAMAVFAIHNTTICQKIIPHHLMGKIFSVRLLIIRCMMPLGVLAGGYLSDMWGVRPLYLLIGMVISTTSLLGILLPYFKFIDEDADKEKEAV